MMCDKFKKIILSAVIFSSSFVYSEEIRCFDNLEVPDASTICGVASSINSILGDLTNGFSIGGCSIGFGGDSGCLTKGLEKSCNNIARGVTGPMRSIMGASYELDLLKGTGIQKNVCSSESLGSVKFPSGLTMDNIYDKTKIDGLGKERGIFSSSIDETRDCMKADGEKCLEGDYDKLPATTLDAKKEVLKAAGVISAANRPIAENARSVQLEYQKKRADCEKRGDSKQCLEDLGNSEFSPESKATTEIINVEVSSAAELAMIMKAAKGNKYYVYKDAGSINKLPIELIGSYRSGVARQNAADSLMKKLYKEIVDIKKASVSSSYSWAYAQSQHFDPKAELQALRDSLTLDASSK